MLQALRGDISIRQLRVMVEHLPIDNPANRELHGPWGDPERLWHDISTQLRMLRAEIYNIVRPESKPPIEQPELLPTPDEVEAKQETRPVEQIQAERDHLRAVIRRNGPS